MNYWEYQAIVAVAVSVAFFYFCFNFEKLVELSIHTGVTFILMLLAPVGFPVAWIYMWVASRRLKKHHVPTTDNS